MRITERIARTFGQQTLRRSALSIGDGERVFGKILGRGRYRRVLEIGTYKGVSAACMAQFVDHVDTIDLHYGRLEHLGVDWDRHAFWDELEITNIDLHLVSNNAEKARLVGTLDFDFAFIDGAHDATVRKDFALVEHCGAVLFHDYNGKANDPVSAFVNSLPGTITTMEIFALWQADHG